MQNGCVRTKKIALDFVFPGGRQPPSTEGLTRSRFTLPRTYQPRNWLLQFVWFVSFIWLNQTNRINQMNQTNQANQKNRSSRYCRCSRP